MHIWILNFLFLFQMISCTNSKMNTQETVLKPLSPFTYEFQDNSNQLSRIDYFFDDDSFVYSDSSFENLKGNVFEIHENVIDDYHYYSIYVYKKTQTFNDNFEGQQTDFDGYNKDLLAYIRFVEGENDIFYILKDGKVVFDAIENQKVSFPFQQ